MQHTIRNSITRMSKAIALSLVVATAQAAAGSEDWDITDTGQPGYEASFTLDEGTWMSLDVSPDGKSIVFDLLGDIYLMPASGGKARLLSGGPAVDRIPSFSPDGESILYISDRSGDDNAWAMNVDGSNARNLTQETDNIITNPAWSPEGEYIYATAVNIGFSWQKKSSIKQYHLAGGTGRVIVKTPENNRDVQEPSLSNDGRYLYLLVA